jgi:superfamily II DNA or RNA helicase
MPSKPVPGLYEELVTETLEKLLADVDSSLIEREELDKGDAHVLLARHVHREVGRILEGLAGSPARQVALSNRILEVVRAFLEKKDASDRVVDPPEALYAVGEPHRKLRDESTTPPRPSIPLGSSDLLVNARDEPRVGHALKREIQSADRIDLLCAFIRWHGVRVLRDELAEHLQHRDKQLRILTTTYMGATQKKALDELAKLGADIRICYEENTTRLHAKAWLLHRKSGYSTAFIGSSNISHSALMDGLEWNVRLSQVETPDILEKFRATFTDYWEDELFEAYDPERLDDARKLEHALDRKKQTDDSEIAYVDLKPYPHQREILEELDAERERHGRFKNLIVSATGTGKTMVAAFDFARWRKENPHGSLLFVAHRADILKQSLRTFRTVLRDGSFGELLVGDYEPTDWNHVFASIQSLSSRGPETIDPEAYDYVIVDEFHHSEARTYTELLDHLEPDILLGLTATPERADGQSVLHWFDGHMAAEIRLWDALERQLLVPFQYFGVHDNTRLDDVKWSGGRYNSDELTNLYTGDHARVALILEEIQDKISDPNRMRALGFCVSIDHADFMAREFNKAGLSALALHSKSSKHDRNTAKHRLISGELQVIFTVDLFNEGVDIPEADTVLFLRPTESATVFLQQLGRGLRHAEGKSCLTVLDFIGHAHKTFRYDVRFRALTGSSRRELEESLESGFPFLPAGCSIELDRVASQHVLENLKTAVGSSMSSVVHELEHQGDVSLSEFLEDAALSPEELYQTENWYWSKFREQAGLPIPQKGPDFDEFGGRLHRILHIDAQDRLDFYDELLAQPTPPHPDELSPYEKRMVYMLHTALWGTYRGQSERFETYADIFRHAWEHRAIKSELTALLGVLDDGASHLTYSLNDELDWGHRVPLSVHGKYSRDEILAAFGLLTPDDKYFSREGVLWLEDFSTDVFFITLEKTEKHYSPQTMYKDYAMSRELFHWESQWNTSADTPTGQRYINHRAEGSHILLFVRRKKKVGGQTQPYTLLGPADYVRHEGDKPMGIVWKLRRPMPSNLFLDAKVVAG